jgi:hypothetical protein
VSIPYYLHLNLAHQPLAVAANKNEQTLTENGANSSIIGVFISLVSCDKWPLR